MPQVPQINGRLVMNNPESDGSSMEAEEGMGDEDCTA
jgi:hypothetical protein